MDKEHIVSQGIALFCIVFGVITVAMGSGHEWSDLRILGASIAGAGLQAVTPLIKQTLNNKAGGTVNLPSGPTDSQ